MTLQLFTAASLALGLAKLLGLHNPFWAAMPVWVVQQAFREDLLFRAGLRVLGTLLGAAVSLALLAAQAPDGVLLVALSLGLGLSAAAAWWIGSVMSYGVYMIGVTMMVVVLPELVLQGAIRPDGIVGAAGGLAKWESLAMSLDRIGCTLLGVICVTAVTFPFTPKRSEPLPRRNPEQRLRGTWRRALFVGATTFVAAGMVLLVPSHVTLAGAMMLMVYPLILSSAPNPAPILAGLVRGVFVGVSAAVSYRLLVSGLASDGAVVALTAAYVAAGAFLRANPRTAGMGLDANMAFLVAAEVGALGHSLPQTSFAGVALVLAAMAAAFVSRRVLIAREVEPVQR